MPQEITSLQEMLDRIGDSANGNSRVSLGTIVQAVGNRSFGPLLLMVGLIAASPLSGMPGVPTVTGILILLIAGQLFFRRESFWLPRWMLRASVARIKVRKAIGWMRPAARFVDRLLKPRMGRFIKGGSLYFISFFCTMIAVLMPMMELVPFSSHLAGIALTAFGLALISRDGLLALIAFVVTAVSLGGAIYKFG